MKTPLEKKLICVYLFKLWKTMRKDSRHKRLERKDAQSYLTMGTKQNCFILKD
jgi:hypothetical protein